MTADPGFAASSRLRLPLWRSRHASEQKPYWPRTAVSVQPTTLQAAPTVYAEVLAAGAAPAAAAPKSDLHCPSSRLRLGAAAGAAAGVAGVPKVGPEWQGEAGERADRVLVGVRRAGVGRGVLGLDRGHRLQHLELGHGLRLHRSAPPVASTGLSAEDPRGIRLAGGAGLTGPAVHRPYL